MQKFALVCYIFFDKQSELDTYYERRHPACEHVTLKVEDRLLIKTLQTEKGRLVEKMIVEFPAKR